MTLEELFLKLGLDVDTAAFARGQALVESLKVGLQLAAKAVKAAFDTTTEVAEWADAVDEASQKTGIGAEALQELAHAASFSGLDLASMTQTLGFLNKSMSAAVFGSKEAGEVWDRLHVPLRTATGGIRGADEVLGDLAERFKAMPDGAIKTALALQVFGKSGAAMIPFLNAGREGIAGLRTEARELGLVLSEDQVKAGAAANDSLDRLKLTWTGLKRVLGAELFPVLTQVTQGISAWVKENRELIKSGLHAFVVVVTGAVHGLRFAWDLMRLVLEFVIKHLKTFAFVLGSIAPAAILLNIKAIIAWTAAQGAAALAAIAAAGTTALAWAAAALPVLALAAAIGVVTYVVWRLRDAILGALETVGIIDLGRAFVELGRNIKDGFVAIFDYLGGRIEWLVDRITWVANKVKENLPSFLGGSSAADLVSAQLSATVNRGVAAVPGAGAIARSIQANMTNTFNITATDPKGVADESAARMKEAQDQQLREALAGIGGG